MKKKDNLTDLIENLPKDQDNTRVAEGQVVDDQGEIITLGQEFANKATKKLFKDRKKD